jgi:hypothetical protein
MRSTSKLDDDVLANAKELAHRQGVTGNKTPPKLRNGVKPLVPKPGAPRPDLRIVNKLRDGV